MCHRVFDVGAATAHVPTRPPTVADVLAASAPQINGADSSRNEYGTGRVMLSVSPAMTVTFPASFDGLRRQATLDLSSAQ